MPKLKYWCAEALDDSACYNIRARTKREAEALHRAYGSEHYGPIHKVILIYKNPMDLVHHCLGEDRGSALVDNDADSW